ncbi:MULTISPECIES: hydrophobe/amphiphile efflux-3 (HAE3) family transporter [unclassified Methanosarcina]|uniref:hydrophobe/amphiphile efflux-3 (HAE3) family transporter n=1 Tax=unclassified Methanosarcina TaxID=2644672 RepID=UPI00064F9749|nr:MULTISPECIES: hydrophobe/amphiphile efflux-3 (HAE3) family transporter [unclassified Methanosarcina]
MKNIFEKLGVFIQSNRPTIIAVMFLLILLSLEGAQMIEMASGTETFVSKGTQLYKDYDHLFKKNFQTENIIVMVEGTEVKSSAVMKAADRLEHNMLTVPGVLSVTSPATLIKQINYKVSGRAKVPDSDREVQDILNIQPGMFESLMPDDTHMVLVIKVAGSSTDQQREDILNALDISLKEAVFPPGYGLIVTGSPALRLDINKEISQSMGILLGIASLLMIVVLLLVFRHVRWGLLPLPVVLLGVLFTFGLMGYAGVPMTMVSMAAFPVLIGLGIDYAIQFHNRMEEEIRAGKSSGKALVLTIKHTGPAVLIALAMTALGFIPLFTSTIPMIQDFGKLLLIGIVMCYISALFFGLVILYSFDWISRTNPFGLFKKKKEELDSEIDPSNSSAAKVQKAQALERFLMKVADFAIEHSRVILVISLLTCFMGIYVDQAIPIQTDIITDQSVTMIDIISALTSGRVFMIMFGIFLGLIALYSFYWISRKNPLGLFNKKDEKIEPETDPSNSPVAEVQKAKALERALIKIADFTIEHSRIILVISLLTCFAGIYADQSVPIQTDTNTFIPQDMPSLVNYKQMQDLISGTGDHLNIILKVKDNSDPEVLKWMDEFSQYEVKNRGHVYEATSIVDLLKEKNGGTIPETSEEIRKIYGEIPESQKKGYIQGSQLLTIDLDIGQAMENLEITGIKELRDIVGEDLQWLQPPPEVTVIITGQSVAMIDIISALTSGRVFMTMLGIVLVLLGLLVVYRDYVKALSPIVPMFIVVGWSGLVMSGLGLSYTPMTAVLGALILGVGSEYSILMMERYFEEKENGLDPVEAINQAMATTGSALIASGATTVFGFSALIFSPFPILSNFGLVTVIDVFLAIFVTFVVFPPLIVMMDTRREKKKAGIA